MNYLAGKEDKPILCDRIEVTADDMVKALKAVLKLKFDDEDDHFVEIFQTDDEYTFSESYIVRREAEHLLKLFDRDYRYDHIDNLSKQNAGKQFNFNNFLSNISIPPSREKAFEQKNCPSQAGKSASDLVHFGPFNQYAIFAQHSAKEFGTVLWVVYDTGICDPTTGYFQIVKTSYDFEKAYEGLDLRATKFSIDNSTITT